ncbi:DEKNAAC100308 [Brettanomyces naardenensis]|uniref:acetyl-CoA C-acyltransferase n=1 Tax=Brettanomyces naardenensis TaxID=13370 RepID=A0A448YG21_BRENA|nr:DEKNAAC100308 [Brettanomyces naardenensis]
MQRLQQISNQLIGNVSGSDRAREKNPDDVVIVAAYRTAIARAGKGKFKDVNSDEILMKLVAEVFKKTKVDKNLIGDVVIGNVLNPGAGVNEHRAAIIAAGLPAAIPFMAVNRQCSSGLMAVNDIANKILTGQIDCGLAGGVESMSKNYGPHAVPKISDIVLKASEDAKNCLLPMGITSENVNAKFALSRKDQDEFAASSYQKAEKATKQGLFKDEILPITVDIEIENDDDDDDKPPNVRHVVVDTDEGPRPNITAQSLAKLRPAFKKDGTSHAGNSSQVSDGAAVVILMRRELAESKGLPVIGKYVATTAVGVPPSIMGVGPAYAIPKVLQMTGIDKGEVQVFEINEAFAGQALYSTRKVGIPIEKVNPRGGAIALGHPLGCTGARQICTLLRELRPGQIGVTSMCIGGGQGAAAVFVRE